MLYVFQMDTGQMLTFDMALLMDTVSRLQLEIAKTTGISVEKQILILSGGQSLKADQKVITYGAGADTNPVFLFSKLAIESQEPPLIRSFGSQKDALIQLRERMSDALKMRPSFDTVTVRTKLAVQIRDSANKILMYCNNEFKEQHLQYQGWGAVVANLEEIAQALQRTESKFCKTFQSFLPARTKHFMMLDSLGESFELLGRIPLLDSLKETKSEQVESAAKSTSLREKSIVGSLHQSPNHTLLEWISSQAQGQSLDSLQQKCLDDLSMFNEEMFESRSNQVQELLDLVSSDKHQMKELVGIERRLSELEKRLNETKKIAKTQNDIAQGFLKHQSQLSTLEDAMAILPDLCKGHQHQLSQMMDGQQRIFALQTNFRNSKQEMSTNIHQRLGWVMHIETQIAKLDSELIFHLKNLKFLECNLDLLSQVQGSPRVYAEMVVETSCRKHFSRKFTQWAEVLVGDSGHLYKAESERRRQFSKRLGDHFLLHTLFKGFEDMPPNFATKVPRMFDASLPNITDEDITMLKSSVPELEESLSVGDVLTQFPLDQLSKQTRDSFEEKSPFSHHTSAFRASACQTSQHSKPCVITATEAPPTLFTLPEIHESHATEYHPALSSLSDNSGDFITSCIGDLNDELDSAPKPKVDGDSQKSIVPNKHRDTKETQTSPIADHPCAKCLKASPETSESHGHPARHLNSAKVTSNTESSSPLSSNEFATADFYFEDSMPSPMAESQSEKKDRKDSAGKEQIVSKVDSETDAIAGLEDQLRQKEAALVELRSLLKERETEVFKMQRQLNVGTSSSRSDGSESSTLVTAHSEVDASVRDGIESGERTICDTKVKGGAGSNSELQESFSLESSIRVQERVSDLEQKLEKLTADLELSKTSLIKAEQNLHDVQQQEQASLEEKNKLISQLQEEKAAKDVSLREAESDFRRKEKIICDLEKDLAECLQRAGALQGEATRADETLVKVKARLRDFVLKTRESIPVLRSDLDQMRSAVRENSFQLESTKTEALEVLFKERERLAREKDEMEQSLTKIQQELSLEIKTLKAQNHEMAADLLKKEEHFAKKYAEQRYDYDSALKDLETKNALELEIELDKCKSETRENMEESERNYDLLSGMKDRLMRDLEETRGQCEKRVKELEAEHQSKLAEVERSHRQKAAETERKLEEMQERHGVEEERLRVDVAAAEQRARDGERAWKEESVQQSTQHQFALSDMKEAMESQRQVMDDLLEQKQQDHADKLTSLKAEFDLEKESLLAQLKKLTELSLTHSETQTGLELMSEVISLTSSVSDGSEEMNSNKSTPASPEEKSNDVAMGDSTYKKMQQRQEELSAELNEAQETIANLSEQLKLLSVENQTLKDEVVEMKAQDTISAESKPMPRSDSENSGLSLSRQEKQMQMSTNAASFILMDKDQSADTRLVEEMRMKDFKITQLEKSLMEASLTLEKAAPSDKVSIKGCDRGDLVLLCLDERHDQYVVFTVGTNLHFLHSESLEGLGLKQEMEVSKRKSWILAEVMDKEYCLAKKPNNRFRVPQGTCFYRVKCQPWKCDFDAARQDTGRKVAKKETTETPSKGKK